VRLDVVYPDERQAARPGQRLRRRDPDEQRADQPGLGRHRDRVEPLEADPGLLERGVDHREDLLEVRSAGDLGDDAAVGGVEARLAVDHRGEDLPPAADDGGRGFVAGGLDAEEELAHGGAGGPGNSLLSNDKDPGSSFRRRGRSR
jgi:hypothetical protein